MAAVSAPCTRESRPIYVNRLRRSVLAGQFGRDRTPFCPRTMSFAPRSMRAVSRMVPQGHGPLGRSTLVTGPQAEKLAKWLPSGRDESLYHEFSMTNTASMPAESVDASPQSSSKVSPASREPMCSSVPRLGIWGSEHTVNGILQGLCASTPSGPTCTSTALRCSAVANALAGRRLCVSDGLCLPVWAWRQCTPDPVNAILCAIGLYRRARNNIHDRYVTWTQPDSSNALI